MKHFNTLSISSALLMLAGGASSAFAHGAGSMGTSHGAAPPMHTQTAPTSNVGPTHATGQPNQTCGSATAPNTPGNAASASGSAFNPTGTAGTMYAGQQTQNSRNPVSSSQYDVACSHQP
jgi:hypothetical protein